MNQSILTSSLRSLAVAGIGPQTKSRTPHPTATAPIVVALPAAWCYRLVILIRRDKVLIEGVEGWAVESWSS